MQAEARQDTRSIDVGSGLTLHVASSGSGSPVLLLHGFTGSGASWHDLRRALEPSHRVLSIDLPGHGASASPRDPARYALPRFAADVVRVLDVLELTRVALLGYSLGGRAALRVALAHPERIGALVLESCSPGIADPQERAARLRADAELADDIERDGVAAFVERWEQLPLWASQATLPGPVRERQRQVRLGNAPSGLAASLRGAGAAAEPDVTGQLHRLTMAALLVAGAMDARYARIATGMAAHMPRAEVAIVDGAGHAVHLEQPEHFASLVGRFLDSFDR